ncbi:hypothetical protein ICW40_05740 [Actinotalea ferrariae]|uniref:hypothetical protein n=1 Tax=Actinotalea ferrariae TaxID=1386098 RepID=UPI001C8BD99B|nr:hypothetical protein [Actinotalea ferrariae]MBX9244308.1 hypothetical protein [Actinotalea ferrariae]
MKLVEWNEVLLSDLRSRGRPERRLYLYVDRETLAEAGALDQQEAFDDFCQAFRDARGSRPFALGASAAARWAGRGFDGEPPFVADLAMTVLAVTEEPIGAPHGVYRTQNSLLGRPAEAEAPAGYGDDVPTMWQVWNRWLEGAGSALGRSSAKTHHVWRWQGWARSQGLVRHRDRLVIEQFVQECGGGTGAIDVKDLVVWMRYRGAVCAELLSRVEHDEAALEVVQDVVDDEVARWRREGPRESRQRTARGLLLYDDWSEELCGVVHADVALVGQVVSVGHGESLTVDEYTPTVRVAVNGAPSAWLHAGMEHALTPKRSVMFGGGSVFVFHDEPELEGRVQTQAASHHVPHHVLVHDSRRRDVEQALRAGGSTATSRPVFDGWSWFDDVVLPREAPLLRALGLSATMPPVAESLSLVGGMRLGRAHQYLCGHEPDVALPSSDARVVVDGTGVAPTHEAPPRVRLAEIGLAPGDHAVEDPKSRLTFRTLAFVRQHAEHEPVLRPGRHDSGDTWTFADARHGPGEGPGLAGARAIGIDVREPVLLHRPGSEYLVLTEDGSVQQVQPLRPRWLGRQGLEPQGLDVDGLASRMEGAAVALARSPRTGAVVAARCGAVRHVEGAVQHVPRPDLVAALISGPEWKWAGEQADDLARKLLSRALRWNAPASKSKPPTSAPQVAQRPGVAEGTLDNPFDEVLIWLSERESASATREDFMRSWVWVCEKLGRHDIASDWRRSLQTLADLGHVEQDFSRGRVFAAPAAAVALPEANGLFCLAGARPARLIERLDDPDDTDPVVADGVAVTSLEMRTAVDSRGRATAPTAVYMEMEPRHATLVRAAYERLGVVLHGCTGRWLIDTMPSLDRRVKSGQHFSHPPGADAHIYAAVQGEWRWIRTYDIDRKGMYRFRQGHRSVFAWRSQPGGQLVEVEPAAGRWLARRSLARVTLVHEHFADRLLVAEDLPLPATLRRALVLRSGMPGYDVRCRLPSGGAEVHMRAYENVNAAVAQQVAHILGAELRSEYDQVKDIDV